MVSSLAGRKWGLLKFSLRRGLVLGFLEVSEAFIVSLFGFIHALSSFRVYGHKYTVFIPSVGGDGYFRRNRDSANTYDVVCPKANIVKFRTFFIFYFIFFNFKFLFRNLSLNLEEDAM